MHRGTRVSPNDLGRLVEEIRRLREILEVLVLVSATDDRRPGAWGLAMQMFARRKSEPNLRQRLEARMAGTPCSPETS